MGILSSLFGSKKLKLQDPDLGQIESFNVSGDKVGWKIVKIVLGSQIEILIHGDKNGVFANQKSILQKALNDEKHLREQSEIALKEQYKNAELEFEFLERHFKLFGIAVENDGFELTFEQKEEPFYLFNVQFQDNQQVGVSIDS